MATENTLTEIDFIAQLINAQKAHEAGYSMPTRWLTLREDLQSQYRKEAYEMYEKWRTEEWETQKSRDEHWNQALTKLKGE